MVFLKNIIKNTVFPFPILLKASRSINNKIEKLSQSTQEEPYTYEYASNNKNIGEKVLLDTLNSTIENKKILEDKAKSTLIAITISSTLIVSILKFLQDIRDNSVFLTIVLLIIGFLSLSYMIVAGLISLHSIGEINTVAIMYPEDYLLPEQEKKTQIADNIEYNYLNNLKRNNFMGISFKCMMVSISLLVVVYIISSLSIGLGHKGDQDAIHVFKDEFKTINNKLSILANEISMDKQNLVDIQREVEDILDNNIIVTKESLISISETLESINKIIRNDPHLVSEEIINLLLNLEKRLGIQSLP